MNEPVAADLLDRSREMLDRRTSTLLAVDLQVTLLQLIETAPRIQFNAGRLIAAARTVAAPLAATLQYPEKLGGPPPELAPLLQQAVAKRAFSCLQSDALAEHLDSGRDQVVVCGIESHVCVLQTAADLLARGFRVYLVADACGARGPLDHELALRRAESLGATLVTTEMVLFEWCGTSLDPAFKSLSALIKQ